METKINIKSGSNFEYNSKLPFDKFIFTGMISNGEQSLHLTVLLNTPNGKSKEKVDITNMHDLIPYAPYGGDSDEMSKYMDIMFLLKTKNFRSMFDYVEQEIDEGSMFWNTVTNNGVKIFPKYSLITETKDGKKVIKGLNIFNVIESGKSNKDN